MDLHKLSPAIKRISNAPVTKELRSITYLSTYPSILSIGATAEPLNLNKFNQLAMMAYGWMPRVIRLDQEHITRALSALKRAQFATVAATSLESIEAIARCLHSVVGASKVLHFINPAIYPIWDSKIERFWAKKKISNKHTKDMAQYMSYFHDVHAIRRDPDFPAFYKQFKVAHGIRLTALGIPLYEVSEVRAIEAAAFELAPPSR